VKPLQLELNRCFQHPRFAWAFPRRGATVAKLKAENHDDCS